MRGAELETDRSPPDPEAAASRLGLGLLLVFLVAFSFRATAWVQSIDVPPLTEPVLDAKFYSDAGIAIASGRGLAPRPYFMSPGYTWFVAAHTWLFGVHPAWVTATQCILDSLACVFTALATARVLGRFAGLSAGLLLALHGTQVFFCLRLLPATLGTFIASLLLLILVRVEARPRSAGIFLAGLVLGIHALIRANILVLLPLLGFLLWRLSRGAGARVIARRLGVLAGGVALVVLPVTIRNLVVGGDFALLTSNGGVNFYIGNAAGGDGRFTPLNNLPLAPGAFSDLQFEQSVQAYVERVEGKALLPSEVSRFWVDRAVEEITADPGGWLLLLLRKAAFFFNAFEVPQVDNLYFMSRYVPVLDGVALHTSRVLWSLGLCGFLLLLWRRPLPLVPVLYLLAFLISILLFFVTARYRLPVLPVIAFGAGYAILRLRDHVRQRSRSSLAGLGLTLAVCVVVVNVNPRLFSGSAHRSATGGSAPAWVGVDAEFLGFAEQHNNLAARWRQWGDAEAAERELRAGLELSPNNPDMLFNLGRILEERGDFAGARSAYEQNLEAQPENADAARLLGRMLLNLGAYGDALAVLQQSLRLTPDHPETWNTFGGVQASLGDLEGALESFERAAALAPAWTDARYNIARMLMRLGRAHEAATDLEDLYQSNPGNDVFAFAYAQVLVETGTFETAAPILDDYLLRYPQDFNALVLRARVELLRGSPDTARPFADRAQSIRPGEPELGALLAEIETASQR